MKSVSPRILYFVPDWPASSSGVLHSTVLAEAAFLHRHGFDCFFVGADVSDEKAAEAEQMIQRRCDIPARVCGCFDAKSGVFGRYFSASKVFKQTMEEIASFCPTHVWTDLFVLSTIGRKIARSQKAISVFDVQAIRAEEVAQKNGRGIKYHLCRLWETYEFRKSDRLVGVSFKLKRWVKDITGRDDLVVVPCCYEKDKFHFDSEARCRIREEYGFKEDEKVICYSGGLSLWQKVPEIVSIFSQIYRARENIKFLFLTQKIQQLRQIIQGYNIPSERIAIRSCMPHEVAQYLSAADVGIILREDIPVNNVASPIKIAEYLGCGLPVILTDCIGDYSRLLSENGVGVLLDKKSDMASTVIDFIESPGFGELRERSISLAHEYLSWDSHLDDLDRLFCVNGLQSNEG